MDLDRAALAKIDRRILSGLDHDEHSQMVRVPVSEAVWSTWRWGCLWGAGFCGAHFRVSRHECGLFGVVIGR